MSRSGYSEDGNYTAQDVIMAQGALLSAIRGKRGQALLKELLEALDAMPIKELIAEEIEASGQVCAFGALGQKRGLDMSKIDPEDIDSMVEIFDCADALVRKIVHMNDVGCLWRPNTPSQRWEEVRGWVGNNIKNNEVKYD